jgi:hypothetical protein
MKQLEVKYSTAYKWWRRDMRDIRVSHLEELKVAAEERIAEMSVQGFSCGELCHETRSGTLYAGWWGITASDNQH